MDKEEIKSKLLLIKDSNIINFREICKRSGVDYNTLSAWLNGNKRSNGIGFYVSDKKLDCFVKELKKIAGEILLTLWNHK